MSEGALVVAAMKAGFGNISNREATRLDPHSLYPRLDNLEVPFSSSRKMMATVHKLHKAGWFGEVYLGTDFCLNMKSFKDLPNIRICQY